MLRKFHTFIFDFILPLYDSDDCRFLQYEGKKKVVFQCMYGYACTGTIMLSQKILYLCFLKWLDRKFIKKYQK